MGNGRVVTRIVGLAIAGLALCALYWEINAHLSVVAIVVVMGVIGAILISHRGWGFLGGALVGAVIGVPLSRLDFSHSQAASGHSIYLHLSHAVISAILVAAFIPALCVVAFYFMGVRTFRSGDDEKKEQ